MPTKGEITGMLVDAMALDGRAPRWPYPGKQHGYGTDRDGGVVFIGGRVQDVYAEVAREKGGTGRTGSVPADLPPEMAQAVLDKLAARFNQVGSQKERNLTATGLTAEDVLFVQQVITEDYTD